MKLAKATAERDMLRSVPGMRRRWWSAASAAMMIAGCVIALVALGVIPR